MANVLMATKTTVATSMNLVTKSARTLESGVNSVGELLMTAEAHAQAYRRRSVRSLMLDEEDAFERAKHQKAMDDASFYRELDNQLKDDPLLKEHYDRAIARYHALDAKVEKTLSVAAE